MCQQGVEEYIVPAMLPIRADKADIKCEHKARAVFRDASKQPVLPNGVFHRLVTKCIRWSQMTSKAQFRGSLSLHEAV